MNIEEEKKDGECSICGKEASLRCGACKQVFYCDKAHQREDWKRHKSHCTRPWEVRENEELGKHLVASRDLRPGEIVICEPPLIWGPALHSDLRSCVGCGKASSEARCELCMWPACSHDCAGLLDKNRHGAECAFLLATKVIPRCDVLLVIRLLILWRTKSKKWAVLSSFESHEESRGPGTEAYDETQNIINHLGPIASIDPTIRDMIGKICGMIDVNAVESLPDGTVAFYETACLLEHSCLPNTRHSFSLDEKGRPRITVKTTSDIEKGDHLTTMYTHALWSTRVRREHLRATKYFLCKCARCADPTELGTHLSSLKCPCKDGSILPKDPLNFDTEWCCDRCPGVLSSVEVAQLTDRLEEEVEEASKLARKEVFSDLLSRLSCLLHRNHQHCIAVGHSLIQLLAPDEPMKAELCKGILEVVDKLDPQGARLALYTAIALRELSKCPGEDRQSLLTRAMLLLKPEPANSPGGKLLKLIEMELC